MKHLRNPTTHKAYCGNVCYGFGSELVDNQFEADCGMCDALNQYAKFEERQKELFEQAKAKEEKK